MKYLSTAGLCDLLSSTFKYPYLGRLKTFSNKIWRYSSTSCYPNFIYSIKKYNYLLHNIQRCIFCGTWCIYALYMLQFPTPLCFYSFVFIEKYTKQQGLHVIFRDHNKIADFPLTSSIPWLSRSAGTLLMCLSVGLSGFAMLCSYWYVSHRQHQMVAAETGCRHGDTSLQ